MLVLSRGRNDKVVFPTLGITIEILRIDGNKIRLGVDAPQQVPILRHELVEESGRSDAQKVESRELSHSLRNRLHTAELGLHLLKLKLEADEAEDAGTTIFTILNELKALEKELEARPEPEPAAATPNAARACRALIVEDNENESELLAGYLRMRGVEVDTASDGLQAMVHLAKHERPDVVLLDMRMPRCDGRKTVSAIRRNPEYRGLKIIAVSGTDERKAEVKIGPEGVNRWFCKPVNPSKLVDAIREELESAGVPA
jgi:carbon storage regulator CsrA